MTRTTSRSFVLATTLAGATVVAACGTPTSAPESKTAGATAAADARGGRDASDVKMREVTVPAGTRLALRLERAIGSDTSRQGDSIYAELRDPIVVGGESIVAAGRPVIGTVTAVQRPGRVKGTAQLAMRFHTLEVGNAKYEFATNEAVRRAPAQKKKDTATIAVPAAGGAIIGAILDGKKGALIGGAVGGGAGTGVVLATRGQDVHLGRGAVLSVTLAEPLTVRVRTTVNGN